MKHILKPLELVSKFDLWSDVIDDDHFTDIYYQ